MKKSELKNIIRESIKELMNEQGPQGCPASCNHANQNSFNCFQELNNTYMNFGNIAVGDFGITQNFHNNMMNAFNNNGCTGLGNRLAQKQNQLTSLIVNGNAGGPVSGGCTCCQGDSPMHQAQIGTRYMYILQLMQDNGCPMRVSPPSDFTQFYG